MGRRVLKFDGPTGRGLWPRGRSAAQVQRVQRVQRVLPASSGRVQRVWYRRFAAMSFYMLPAGGKSLHNRASPVEMHPFWCCAPPFPRRGNFTLRSVLELISTPMESAAKTSPSGEGAAEGGRRGAFPTPAGRLYGFIQTGGAAAHHHPLNPLHLLNPLNLGRLRRPFSLHRFPLSHSPWVLPHCRRAEG